jgi:hypothetical protein
MYLSPFDDDDSIFNQVRNNIRARAVGRQTKPVETVQDQISAAASGTAPSSPTSPVSPATYSPTAMAAPEVAQAEEPGFFQQMSDIKAGVEGEIAGVFGAQPNAAAEAAIEQAQYQAYDTKSTMGQLAESVRTMLDPTPYGVISSFMTGKTVTMPTGQPTYLPGGVLGKIGEMNVTAQYNIAEQVMAGTPGYHQFNAGTNLVGITPGPMGKGYTVTGQFQGTPEQAISMYAAGVVGVDPRTVDLSKDPNAPEFGDKLSGWTQGVGGVAKDGMYVSAVGEVSNPSQVNFEAHVGLVNDIAGQQAALNAIQASALADTVKSEMMTAVQMGGLHAEVVTDAQGNIVGYQTAETQLTNMFDSEGKPVTSGNTTYMSVNAYNALQANARGTPGVDEAMPGQAPGDWSGNADSGYMGAGPDTGFAGVAPSDFSFGVDLSDDVADNESYSASDFDAGVSDGDAAAGFSGPFARGGRAMAEGGPTPAVLNNPEQTETAGFVDRPPEQVPDAETVADNVPADVEEGTFVLNAPAVEFMGSDDVKKMLIEATDEAKRQGVDIVQNNTKMDKKKLLSLVVSKGEVLIPPVLAKIIGYDRLEKINNRGKQEVEKRIAENGQDIPPEAQQAAAEGGEQSFIKKPDQTDEFANIYSSIQRQGGDPRLGFKDFTKTMKAFAKGRIYRPMQAEPNTPAFDVEVKEKYNLFFLDEQKYPYMDEAEREAAREMDRANMIDMSLPLAREREDGTIYYVDRQSGKEVPNPNSGEGFAPAP